MAGLGGNGMKRALLAVLVLAFLSGGVRAAINPQFFWKPQELHSCAVAEPSSPTTCKCYSFDPNNQLKPCDDVKPIIGDADFVTDPPQVQGHQPWALLSQIEEAIRASLSQPSDTCQLLQ